MAKNYSTDMIKKELLQDDKAKQFIAIEDLIPNFTNFHRVSEYSQEISSALFNLNQEIDNFKDDMVKYNVNSTNLKKRVFDHKFKYYLVNDSCVCTECSKPLFQRGVVHLFPCKH